MFVKTEAPFSLEAHRCSMISGTKEQLLTCYLLNETSFRLETSFFFFAEETIAQMTHFFEDSIMALVFY